MKYCERTDTIELSVEELCHMALMQGSIDNRLRSRTSVERKTDRDKAQSLLCSRNGAWYHGEVELVNTCKLDGIYFCITGCADGILRCEDRYCVDEIRVSRINRITDKYTNEYHNARLGCYAYFLCCAKDLNSVYLRNAYYDAEKNEIEFSQAETDASSLRNIYVALLSKIVWRAHILRDRCRERIPSAAAAVFPYKALRDSQGEMIKECYRDIKHGNRLFCQAPTGIGKTVSTLYPAVKCVGECVADKVFYLTSKQSIRREAISAMEKMNKTGVGLRTCVISSRDSMCKNAAAKLRGGRLSSSCNPDLCPYAKGYYDRISYALADIIASGNVYDSGSILKIAEKYRICPYELSLDLSELCDVIVCDYNYVFSPTVYLKRYFEGDRDEKYIFLVDEAHNLPDRAREMFSARLSKRDFESLLAILGENSTISTSCLTLITALNRIGKFCEDDTKMNDDGGKIGFSVSHSIPERLTETLTDFSKKCDIWMKNNPDHSAYLYVEDICYKIFEYCKIAERYDKGYITFITKTNDDVLVLLYCLDPSNELSIALSRAQASVLFSATLTPTDYFADILGGGKKTVSVSFRSPFPSDNLCVAIADKISTRYEDREKSYKKISSYIAATVSAKRGNYMVFFPSYSYMTEVRKIFSEKYPKVKVIEQTKNMTAQQKEEFLSSFVDDGKLRIAFCVLGGSFSEGIDLPGNKLIGVICVGVGLPGLSSENNIIRDYYEEKSGCGYDYAYTYPGMNSILQAVGRVIRTETDRGIAVLIDDRYAEPKYRNMFPDEWKTAKFAGNAQSLAEIARKFWNLGE